MSNSPQGQTTILIVDDEPIALEFCRSALTRAGYRVLTAASADEAVRWFAPGHSSIALALLDVVMPGTGGAALAQRIVKLRPDTRIVLKRGAAEYSESDCSKVLKRIGTLVERARTMVCTRFSSASGGPWVLTSTLSEVPVARRCCS